MLEHQLLDISPLSLRNPLILFKLQYISVVLFPDLLVFEVEFLADLLKGVDDAAVFAGLMDRHRNDVVEVSSSEAGILLDQLQECFLSLINISGFQPQLMAHVSDLSLNIDSPRFLITGDLIPTAILPEIELTTHVTCLGHEVVCLAVVFLSVVVAH